MVQVKTFALSTIKTLSLHGNDNVILQLKTAMNSRIPATVFSISYKRLKDEK